MLIARQQHHNKNAWMAKRSKRWTSLAKPLGSAAKMDDSGKGAATLNHGKVASLYK